MKKFLVFIFITVVSCSRPTEQAKPGEGTVVYRVSYPDSTNYGLKSKFFPSSITLVFKNDKATFIASAALGMMQLVNILDHNTRSFHALLIDDFRGNFGCKFSENEIKKNEANPFLVDYTEDTAFVAGIKCAKAILHRDNEQVEVFYDPKVKFYYWNSPFKNFKNLMLKYSHIINGLKMNLEAVRIDTSTAVDTSLFSVKGTYQWIDEKAFYNRLTSL